MSFLVSLAFVMVSYFVTGHKISNIFRTTYGVGGGGSLLYVPEY